MLTSTRALKWHYGAATEDKSINEARANAAEIVAWRFLTHLSEREVVDYCLYEIPDPGHGQGPAPDEENGGRRSSDEVDENTALLAQSWADTVNTAKSAITHNGSNKRYQLMKSISRLTVLYEDDDGDGEGEDPTKPFVTLNALEIAAVADAKRFLSQHVVQKIITGIWNGDIVFWEREFLFLPSPAFFFCFTVWTCRHFILSRATNQDLPLGRSKNLDSTTRRPPTPSPGSGCPSTSSPSRFCSSWFSWCCTTLSSWNGTPKRSACPKSCSTCGSPPSSTTS